jgi:uncharacterized membrane protein
LSHLSPEEVERIKEEQRIRSVEGVKSVTKHLFKLYLKILGIFLAIIFGLGIIAVIIATVLGGIGRLKTQNSLRQFSVTQTVIAELAVATSQSFTSTDPAIQTQESTNLNQSSSTPSMGAPG